MQLPYIGSARGYDARLLVDRDLEWIAPFAARPDNLVRLDEPLDASFVASLSSALVIEEWNERHPDRVIPRGVRMIRPVRSDSTAVEVAYLRADTEDLEGWMLGAWPLPASVRSVLIRAERLRDLPRAARFGFRDDVLHPGFLARSVRA